MGDWVNSAAASSTRVFTTALPVPAICTYAPT